MLLTKNDYINEQIISIRKKNEAITVLQGLIGRLMIKDECRFCVLPGQKEDKQKFCSLIENYIQLPSDTVFYESFSDLRKSLETGVYGQDPSGHIVILLSRFDDINEKNVLKHLGLMENQDFFELGKISD